MLPSEPGRERWQLESVDGNWLAAYAVGLAVAQRDPDVGPLPGSTEPSVVAAAAAALERLDHLDGEVIERARRLLGR